MVSPRTRLKWATRQPVVMGLRANPQIPAALLLRLALDRADVAPASLRPGDSTLVLRPEARTHRGGAVSSQRADRDDVDGGARIARRHGLCRTTVPPEREGRGLIGVCPPLIGRIGAIRTGMAGIARRLIGPAKQVVAVRRDWASTVPTVAVGSHVGGDNGGGDRGGGSRRVVDATGIPQADVSGGGGGHDR